MNKSKLDKEKCKTYSLRRKGALESIVDSSALSMPNAQGGKKFTENSNAK